jgi:hypothetical protein
MRVDRRDVAMSRQALRKLYDPQYEIAQIPGARASAMHFWLSQDYFFLPIQMNDASISQNAMSRSSRINECLSF